jgi:hypothetical protein
MELFVEGAYVSPRLSHSSHRTRPNTPQIFYTLSSFYIIFLMTSVYARTREREKAWKFGMYCLLGSVVIAPFWYLIFKEWVIGRSTTLRVRSLASHPCIPQS